MAKLAKPFDSLELRQALKDLLMHESPANQHEIVKALEKRGLCVNQSTVSRLLRKLQVIRTTDPQGRLQYRLSNDVAIPASDAVGVTNLVQSVDTNGTLVVIRTTTGSAQLVAQYLDRQRLPQILGTLAGDDTIFIAPSTPRVMNSTIEAIRRVLTPAAA